MTEFVDVGAHCSLASCKQKDFLPFRCPGCSKDFCSDHGKYEDHECPTPLRVDVKAPECPVCGAVIPVAPGESPDAKVDQHIAQGCRRPLTRQVTKYSCSLDSCTKSEMMQVSCRTCGGNYCLRHRHEDDHNCAGAPPGLMNRLFSGASSTAGQPRRSSSPGGRGGGFFASLFGRK